MLRGVYGYVGSGKNVIETIDMCYKRKEIPIFTNFDLRLKNASKIEPEEVFEVFELDDKIPVKYLVTDEAYTWFESRGSAMSELNKFLSYLMFQSRKRGLNWHSIAQIRGTLDLRWRGMEDNVLACGKRNLDSAGNSTDDFKFALIENMQIKRFGLRYEKAKPFFDKYNTRQVLMPQEFLEMKQKLKNRKPEELNNYIDSLVEELKKFPPPTKQLVDGTIKLAITQEWVRDMLLRIGRGWEFSSYVKVRLATFYEKGKNDEVA